MARPQSRASRTSGPKGAPSDPFALSATDGWLTSSVMSATTFSQTSSI